MFSLSVCQVPAGTLTPNTHALSPNTCVLGYLVIQIVYRFKCVCVCVWLSVSLCLSCDRLAASPDPFSSPVRAPYSHEFGQAVKIIDEYCICVWSSESLLMSAFFFTRQKSANYMTMQCCPASDCYHKTIGYCCRPGWICMHFDCSGSVKIEMCDSLSNLGFLCQCLFYFEEEVVSGSALFVSILFAFLWCVFKLLKLKI